MLAVRRLQWHNRGHEIRVPPDLCKELRAGRGDYLFFDWEPGGGSAKLSKVPIGASKNDERTKEQAVIAAAI